MIPIDERADTFPVGLQGTPFEEVYKALRAVAASVWAVDPAAYRAGMAWGWYALNAPDKLAGFRAVVVAALISAFAPMIKDNQTDVELVEYLLLWRAYKPTFGALGELFSTFGASVEVLAISDEESQSVVPVSGTRLAFYLRITGIDFSRPLSLSEAVEIARRATPLGSRPFAYYAIPSRITVPCGPAPEPAFVFVENDTIAELPAMGYIVLNSETGAILGAAKGHELETVPIPACVIASAGMECVPIPARVLETPEMAVYVPTVVELPEVTFANDTSAGNWIIPRSGDTVSINADSVVEGYYWTGSEYQPTTYNSSKVYAAIEWLTRDNAFGGRVEFQFVNYNGTIGIKNNTSGTLVFAQAHLAACHSTDATVVPVYDSSNNAYNAFKFTVNNIDYYYVLDGTQMDWTDDLSSIGYSLEPEPEPEYEQINLYIPGGGSNYYYYQGGVTLSSAWNPTDSYTKTLYDSGSLTNVARVRPGVRYEPGYVSNNGWVPYTPQNLSGMPASQSSSDYKTTYLVQTLNGSVQFWYVTNFPSNSVYETYSLDPYYFAFRLYPAQYIDVILALNGDGTGVTFSADDYWASNVKATDVMYSLRDFGVPTRTASDSSQSIVIDRTAFENFTFVPIALYTDTAGTVNAGADMSNFYCKVGGNGTGIYGTSVNIRSINAYNTTVCRWKCRITRINGGN